MGFDAFRRSGEFCRVTQIIDYCDESDPSLVEQVCAELLETRPKDLRHLYAELSIKPKERESKSKREERERTLLAIQEVIDNMEAVLDDISGIIKKVKKHRNKLKQNKLRTIWDLIAKKVASLAKQLELPDDEHNGRTAMVCKLFGHQESLRAIIALLIDDAIQCRDKHTLTQQMDEYPSSNVGRVDIVGVGDSCIKLIDFSFFFNDDIRDFEGIYFYKNSDDWFIQGESDGCTLYEIKKAFGNAVVIEEAEWVEISY